MKQTFHHTYPIVSLCGWNGTNMSMRLAVLHGWNENRVWNVVWIFGQSPKHTHSSSRSTDLKKITILFKWDDSSMGIAKAHFENYEHVTRIGITNTMKIRWLIPDCICTFYCFQFEICGLLARPIDRIETKKWNNNCNQHQSSIRTRARVSVCTLYRMHICGTTRIYAYLIRLLFLALLLLHARVCLYVCDAVPTAEKSLHKI